MTAPTRDAVLDMIRATDVVVWSFDEYGRVRPSWMRGHADNMSAIIDMLLREGDEAKRSASREERAVIDSWMGRLNRSGVLLPGSYKLRGLGQYIVEGATKAVLIDVRQRCKIAAEHARRERERAAAELAEMSPSELRRWVSVNKRRAS